MAAPNEKKQLLLRISGGLYADLAAWAEDDFRSVNGQIEYLLTQCVKERRRSGRYTPREDALDKRDGDD